MKKRLVFWSLLVFVFGMYAEAWADTEVRMTGDARIHATYSSHRRFANYLNEYSYTLGGLTGRRLKEEKFAIWQRFRLRMDFIANEALKFRLGVQVNNSAWGDPAYGTNTGGRRSGGWGAYDVNNASIEVYLAYLQFMWPGTDIQFTIGKQPLSLPQAPIFNSSVVTDDSSTAAITIDAPLIDKTLSVIFGYSRTLDNNPVWQDRTELNDDIDTFFVIFPITLDGFTFKPWAVMAVVGTDANSNTIPSVNFSDFGWDYVAPSAVVSPHRIMAVPGHQGSHHMYWWFGTSIEVSYFEPIRFYADVIYGMVASNRRSNNLGGWFIDAALEYTGLDWITPQFGGWWSSGVDKSWRNGQERMPHLAQEWSPGGSYLFDGGKLLASGPNSMNINPVGTWGLFLSFKDVTFWEGLTHRLTFAFANGTSSPTGMRNINQLAFNTPWLAPANWGVDNYYIFGRDLTWNDWVFGVNFDHYYKIYENLTLALETGWAHGSFSRKVWGSRLVDSAKISDSWKVAFGFVYNF